jgi:hypothetical protein
VTPLLLLLALAAVVAMLLTADRVKSSGFEWSLLAVSALVQLALLFMGWGDFSNVHGGAVLLMLVLLVGAVTALGVLFLALRDPCRWRFLRLIGVAAFTVLLVVSGDAYGG